MALFPSDSRYWGKPRLVRLIFSLSYPNAFNFRELSSWVVTDSGKRNPTRLRSKRNILPKHNIKSKFWHHHFNSTQQAFIPCQLLSDALFIEKYSERCTEIKRVFPFAKYILRQNWTLFLCSLSGKFDFHENNGIRVITIYWFCAMHGI